jgi:hypothetical protein
MSPPLCGPVYYFAAIDNMHADPLPMMAEVLDTARPLGLSASAVTRPTGLLGVISAAVADDRFGRVRRAV